jgi:hypothetical protein
MRKSTLLAALACCAALAVPAVAAAKGASEAKLEGEGLEGGGIVFSHDSGDGATGGSALNRLAEGSGFYPAVFGQEPSPMEPGRPPGDLGRKYTVTYTMPGPDNALDELRQDIYPYAQGGAVTYVAPGQPFFGGDRTKGGWFRGYADLKQLLVDAGLPATQPTGGTGAAYDVSWPAAALSAVVVALLGTALVFVVRRRPGPLPAR